MCIVYLLTFNELPVHVIITSSLLCCCRGRSGQDAEGQDHWKIHQPLIQPHCGHTQVSICAKTSGGSNRSQILTVTPSSTSGEPGLYPHWTLPKGTGKWRPLAPKKKLPSASPAASGSTSLSSSSCMGCLQPFNLSWTSCSNPTVGLQPYTLM